MKILTKPLKDMNLIDLGILSLGAAALIPVSFFVIDKSFDMVNYFNDKLKSKRTEVTEDEGA